MNINYLTNETVKSNLNVQKNRYSSNTHDLYWNHTPNKNYNAEDTTVNPCEHHGSTCLTYDGSCGCNFFGKGIQCHGFALLIANKVFGTYPEVNTSPSASDGVRFENGWRLYTKEYCRSLMLEPGDVIRINGHSAIIHNVETNGAVSVGEVWGGRNCIIKWGFFDGSNENRSPSLRFHDGLIEAADFIAKAPKLYLVSFVEQGTVK